MNNTGYHYNDYAIGETIKHRPSKTILESDNNLFCLLTMNHHPVHINEDYAKSQQHGKILVVGTLVFSLGVGLTVNDISLNAIANLDYEAIRHLAPVFIGDTLYAQTTILDKRLSKSKPDRGILYVETVISNQHEAPVLSFRRHVLIKVKALEERDVANHG